MDTFRKIIAGLCAVFFVISGMLALFAFNVEQTAFNSTTYKRAFESQNLYERMPEVLATALYTTTTQKANTQPFLKALTVNDLKTVINSLLPPAELKAITDNTLDSIFDYLNGKTTSVVIVLTPLKSHLIGPAGISAIKEILHAQPACTTDQLLQMGLGLLNGNIALCNPPEQMLGVADPVIESQLQSLTTLIPDQVDLLSGTQSKAANASRAELNQIRTVMKITPVFPLLFLFCLTIFGIRNLTDWLKWWGYPFLMIGALSAAIALIGSPIFGLIFQQLLHYYGASFIPPILSATMSETASAVAGQILKPITLEGLGLFLLGLFMITPAIFLGRRR